MKKKKWLDLLVIFYLVAISVIIRNYYMSAIDTLNVSGDYLTAAWNVDSSNVPLSSFDIKGIYTWLLSQVMLFFGKKTIFALYLNIAIQTVDVLLIYGCFRFVFGRMVSSIISIVISSIPFFYQTIRDISPYNLTNCFILLCIYLFTLIIYLIVKGISLAKKNSSEELIEEEEDNKVANENSYDSESSVDDTKSTIEDTLTIDDSNAKDDNESLNNTKIMDDKEAFNDAKTMDDTSKSEAIDPVTIKVTEESTEKEVTNNLIEAPLPLPKKHVKKEMSYAFDPKFDMMHYDLEDMTDKDFYDIE